MVDGNLKRKVVHDFQCFLGFFFLEIIDFPGQTVNFCLYHVLHILKAIDLTANLGHLESLLEHPTSIFAGRGM